MSIDTLFTYNFLVSFNLNGCFTLMSDILLTNGASRKVMDAIVPYNKSSCRKIVDSSIKIVSITCAEELAKNALYRCIELRNERIIYISKNYSQNPPQDEIHNLTNTMACVGVGVSCDYNSGECYACVYINKQDINQDINQVIVKHLSYVNKDDTYISLSKQEKDRHFSNMLINLLCDELSFSK